MKSIIALGMCLAALTCGTACRQIDVSFLTTALPGRTAVLDPEENTLRVSRGLAVALECTEWTESFYGPCRDMTVGVDDDDLADILPVHLDAFGGSYGNAGNVSTYDDGASVSGTADRAGALVAAKSAGETTLLVTSQEQDVALTLVVEPTPDDVEGDGDDAQE